VLTRNEAIDHLNQVFSCSRPRTSEDRRQRSSSEMADGMPRPCVLNADHVATLPQGNLGDLITTLRAESLAVVRRALGHATGC
jgi:mRNA-degrading endonuclease toxin of MazEF toxin-antitoxin module